MTHATGFQGGDHGAYREARSADLRQVSRVAWQDYLTLLPGEAVVMFGGRRIYAKLLRVPLDITGWPRLNRPLMLAAPRADQVRVSPGRIAALRDRIEAGLVFDEPDEPASPTLAAMVKALHDSAVGEATTGECIDAMLAAAGQLTEGDAKTAAALPSRSPDMGDEDDADDGTDGVTLQPITEFSPMLDRATSARPPAPGRSARPHEPVDVGLLADLVAIEVAAGVSKVAARASALTTLGDRDAALAGITWPEPPPLRDGELRERLERLNAQLAALGVAELPGSEQPTGTWRAAAE